MPENDDQHYDLEPGDHPRESPGAHPAPRPAPEQNHDDDSSSDVHALDVCPECGAPMRDSDQLVCMRCGFDLKTMKRIETATGSTSVDEDAGSAEVQPPLSAPGRGEFWLPGVIAGASVLLLVIGYAGGVGGLYDGAAEPNFGVRLMAIVKLLVRLLTWGGCVVGALWCTARLLNQQPLGEIRLVALRALAAVAAVSIIRFLNLEHDSWERGVELVLQAGLFPFLLLALFGVNLRDAALSALIALAALLTMVLAPLIVSWSMSGDGRRGESPPAQDAALTAPISTPLQA
jgi:hypothetical protein